MLTESEFESQSQSDSECESKLAWFWDWVFQLRPQVGHKWNTLQFVAPAMAFHALFKPNICKKA